MERRSFGALMYSTSEHGDYHCVEDEEVCAHAEDGAEKFHNYAAASDQRHGSDHLKEETMYINNPHHITICEHASEKSPI